MPGLKPLMSRFSPGGVEASAGSGGISRCCGAEELLSGTSSLLGEGYKKPQANAKPTTTAIPINPLAPRRAMVVLMVPSARSLLAS